MVSTETQNLVLIAILATATTAALFVALYNPLSKTKKESKCAKKTSGSAAVLPSGATQSRKTMGPCKASLQGEKFEGRLLEK